MNNFGKILIALVTVIAALLAISRMIESFSDQTTRKRRISDLKSKLQIAGVKQKKQIKRIANELGDSIADFRDEDDDDLEVIIMDKPSEQKPVQPAVEDIEDDDISAQWDFDLDADIDLPEVESDIDAAADSDMEISDIISEDEE